MAFTVKTAVAAARRLRPSGQIFGDTLAVVQVIGALIVGLSQAIRFMTHVEGQLLSVLTLMELYMVLNLRLAQDAHKTAPSRITAQTVGMYWLWIGLLIFEICMLVIHPDWHWLPNDTATVKVALLGLPVVAMAMVVMKLPVSDPLIKAIIAIFARSIPQFLMAYTILQDGGDGVPFAAIIVGNMTISLRALQAGIAVYQSPGERNRLWLLLTELSTELSWAAVSVAWAWWWYSLPTA